MKKVDCLILCQFFYPEYVSSAALPLEMAEDFVENGISVNVLCGYPKEYLNLKNNSIKRQETYNGVNIKRVRYIQLSRKRAASRLINQLSFILSILLRIKFIAKHKCVIVYSDPPMLPVIAAIANKIFHTKYIFVAYDIFPDIAAAMKIIKKNSLMARIMEQINRGVYSGASKVIALSSEMKEYILKNKLPNSPHSVEMIPNWYDAKKLKYGVISDPKVHSIKSGNKFIVLYSGNMGTCQDMDTIMKAVLRLKNENEILFVFTGHGNKMNAIKRTINENKLTNVMLFGFLSGDDYSDILQLADCHIVSLEKDAEGLCAPSKTYGYLAAGRTLLAIMSENTDIARMLKEYNAGFTFEQGDYEGFSNMVSFLNSNRDENRRLGNNARNAFLSLYERKICTGKYIRLVLDLVG